MTIRNFKIILGNVSRVYFKCRAPNVTAEKGRGREEVVFQCRVCKGSGDLKSGLDIDFNKNLHISVL